MIVTEITDFAWLQLATHFILKTESLVRIIGNERGCAYGIHDTPTFLVLVLLCGLCKKLHSDSTSE